MARFALYAALLWAATLLSAGPRLVAAADLPNLRIMPLGDSITKGSGSSDLNGYRKRLRGKLVADGVPSIDMIGSLRHGNMRDNDHEGHSGKYLREMAGFAGNSIAARPNVVLIHAGTNNMDYGIDLDEAATLMKNLITGIMNNAPEAVVLVAPVIWANDANMQRNTDKFNNQIRSIIKERQEANKRVLEVPIDITLSDLHDKKHPNNVGYAKMADAWYNAIHEANSLGWLKEPIKMNPGEVPGVGLGINTGSGGSGNDPDIAGGTSVGCEPTNWEKKGTIFDDYRVWQDVGTIRGPVDNANRDRLILADLNNDGIADYIMPESDGTVRAWINGGKPNQWTSLGKINPAWSSVTGNMVRMVDVDNDGKADMIVLYSDGAAKVWKNQGDGKFTALDPKWATGLDSRGKVTFQDMDGDGYADYVIVESNGQVKWARNTHNNGKDPDKRNWETAKTIAPGPQGIPSDRARLYDLDGDKKSDYVIVYAGGAVRAFRNLHGDGEDRTWEDLGTIAPGVSGVTGDMIRFADMDGDGLADFLAVGSDGSIKMWKNTGTGFSAKGVTFRLADLTGDGKADIIAVDAKGRAQAWLNKGLGKAWESIGEIAPGLDEDLSSSRIEFADVNGDGLADYLVIYGGGAVKAYLNNGNIPDAGKSRNWQPGLTIAPGVGEPGHKIRFADLNGDGYADYIVVFDGGAADVYLNQKNIPPNGGRIWADKQTAAGGVGAPGNKIVFADINGDGLAEYIVQYDGGASRGYNNTGNIPDAGKSRNWGYMGTIAAGVSPQGPVVYADIDGDGKADYLVVFDTGRINAYINSCDWRPIPSSGNDNGGDGGDGNGGGIGNSDDDDGDDDGDDGGAGEPTRTNTAPWPMVTGRGHCDGPDCEGGKCTGVLCGSFDCEGDDCYNGYCIGRDCTAIGCIGPGCKNGKCVGLGCKTTGCLGDDCDPSSGRCKGPKCVSIHCSGPQCGTDGTCIGPGCSKPICFGINCSKGVCLGAGCHPAGGQGGGGSNAPPPAPSQPEDCVTTTFEACNTRCTYYSTTTKCSTDCTDIEACTRPTDSSTATTKTCPIPVVTNDWVEDDPDAPAPTLGDGGLNGEWANGELNVGQGTRPTQTKTSAPASPTKTEAPMKRNQPVCHDESDFPGHADIRAESVESLAFDFCDIAGPYEAIGPGQEIKETLSDKYGIKFRFSIKWVDGCITSVDKQEVIYPLTEDDRDWPWGSECWVIFRDSWELCNNGGVAGYSDAACLRYQLDAGI